MAFEFFHKQWVCDFENLESNKISKNKMLEVTAEDTVSAHKYMQISFTSNYFQDNGEDYLFSNCYLGDYAPRYDYGYFNASGTYNLPNFFRTYVPDPKFIAFDNTSGGYQRSFTADIWEVIGNFANPDKFYEDWVINLKDSYTAAGLPPESVNLYVFKIINLKFDSGFYPDARYIPIFYMGNDPNA